jgi:hypothetical protein
MVRAKNHSERRVAGNIRTCACDSQLALATRIQKAMFRPRLSAVGCARSSLRYIGRSARTSRSPRVSIGTELLAAGEEIEVTRNGAPFEQSPVPMSRAIAATHGLFAHLSGERLKPETRWRREVDSNYRYRF